MLRPALALMLLAAASLHAKDESLPAAIASETLHNLFKVDARLYSGSSPDDDAGFTEIKALGVTTIVSVDGSKPNLELARKHGLKYIHLPIGYDGVPTDRIAELIKSVRDANGPVYMHCHHGKHRGPAAVAVVCEGLNGWTADAAVLWLKQAGTADDYAGLYRDVRNFRAPDPGTLAKLPAEFPEVVPTPPLVDIMVSIDERFEQLKTLQKGAWAADAQQSATLLWEHYREMSRMEDTATQPADYREKLTASEAAVQRLREALREPNTTPVKLDAAFKEIGQQCAACHKAYRNKK